MKHHCEQVWNIRPLIDKYNWNGRGYPISRNNFSRSEKKNQEKFALFVLYVDPDI